MNFIDDLKRFMARHYLSVSDLSDLFGISRSTAYRLLNGQKKVTRPELDGYLAAMAKRDPSFFSKPKLEMLGFTDDFYKGCLKQHRETLAEIQIEVRNQKNINKSFSEFLNLTNKDVRVQKSDIEYLTKSFKEICESRLEDQNDITNLWSELQAVNACLDRKQAEIEILSKRGMWNKIKSIFRGDKNGR